MRRGFPPVFLVWPVGNGGCGQPDRAIPAFKPSPTGRAAYGAQKSVRPVQCGSQAIAQIHQGPRNLGGTMRALELLPRERLVPTAVSEGSDQSASIIAPGREGSQSEGQPRITKARRRLSKTAGLGTAARSLPASAAVSSGNDLEVLRLSRLVVRGVNRAARRGVGCQEGRPMSVYRIASKRE